MQNENIVVAGQRRLIMNREEKQGIAKQVTRSTAGYGTKVVTISKFMRLETFQTGIDAEPMDPKDSTRLEGWMT